MDNYDISNKVEIDVWMHQAQSLGQNLVAIKGAPPYDAIYSDGTPVINPVNLAWKNVDTGDVINIEYRLNEICAKGGSDG